MPAWTPPRPRALDGRRIAVRVLGRLDEPQPCEDQAVDVGLSERVRRGTGRVHDALEDVCDDAEGGGVVVVGKAHRREHVRMRVEVDTDPCVPVVDEVGPADRGDHGALVGGRAHVDAFIGPWFRYLSPQARQDDVPEDVVLLPPGVQAVPGPGEGRLFERRHAARPVDPASSDPSSTVPARAISRSSTAESRRRVRASRSGRQSSESR